MHLLKNKTDFNKLRAREIENKQKNQQQFQIIRKKYGAKKWENFTSFFPLTYTSKYNPVFCRTRVTNGLIQKPNNFNKLKGWELEKEQNKLTAILNHIRKPKKVRKK